jgi:hypothetical protein
MILHLEVLDDESGTDIHDLLAWLRADDDVDSGRLVEVVVPAEEGDMAGGGILAAVETVVETVVAEREMIVAVIGAVGGWLSARAASRRTRIKVRCGKNEVEIDTAQLDDADEIALRIHQELRDMA